VALNTPSNLSLGKLGHIAAGNGNSTTETSLNACGRDSGTGETAMWANFKIGDAGVIKVSGATNSGTKLTIKIRPKGDVGIYMGNGSDGDYIEGLFTSMNGSVTYQFELYDSNEGSLYASRIGQNSDNAADYQGIYAFTVEGDSFSTLNNAGGGELSQGSNSTNTDKDRFKYSGGV
jgi:hypothetical protein